MRKLLALVGICGIFVAVAVAASGAAATAPTVEHFHFTSDPFTTTICGIDVIGVDTVSGNFVLFTSGASISGGEGATILTNPVSRKSISFRNAGVQMESTPIENGNGTFSVVLTVNGLSPKISVLNGPPLDGIDTGSITFLLTFDANGNFVSFDVVSIKGPRPAGGCDLITAALT